MQTSGGGAVALLYVALLASGVSAAGSALGDLGPWLRAPRPAAVTLWLVVAVPSVVGLAVPEVYATLYRDPTRVREGQWWRLLTAATVQDGGVLGAVFNLVALALIATLAVHLLGGAQSSLLLVVGAVAFNLAAVLSAAPGAGNSGATFFLAATMVGTLFRRRRAPRVAVAALVTLLLGAALLVVRDAHGLAALTGLLVGVLVPDRHRRARGIE